MELVRQFSSELNSIYDGKLPVSRAKMASITKSAVKSLKYYKHVVMTVEKFISKCGPEYKLPGLYVVDSIVRQSRHQFGTEKDVYGPRFSKNFEKTFKNIFLCTPSDQPKIMRVLNLWQKNEVFPTGVIQKVMALAPNPDATPSSTAPPPPLSEAEELIGDVSSGALDLSSANALIQQQQTQIQSLLQRQEQMQSQTSSLLAPALQGLLAQPAPVGLVPNAVPGQVDVLSSLLQQAQQLQTLQQQLAATGTVESEPQPVFNTALLDNDFDYSSEEEGGGSASRNLSRQRESRRQEVPREPSPPPPEEPVSDSDAILRQLELQVMRHQQKFKQKELEDGVRHGDGSAVPAQQHHAQHGLPPHHSHPLGNQEQAPPPPPPPVTQKSALENYPPLPVVSREHHPSFPPVQQEGYLSSKPPIRGTQWEPRPSHDGPRPFIQERPPLPPPPGMPYPLPTDIPPPPLPHPPASFFPPPHRTPSPPAPRRDRFRPSPPNHGGQRRSPSPPSRRSSGYWRESDRERSRDRDRDWDSRHSGRSRSPHRHRSRSPHAPRRATPPLSAEEKDRRRRGIPVPRPRHFSVCSCTIWVGHLSKTKTVTQQQIRETFEDYGQVKSVDVVAARGCAYVVMVHRSDAVRALSGLKDARLYGSQVKLAWAPGRGVKSATFRSYWNIEEGVSYIPWDMIKKETELVDLADGSWVDPRSCSPEMTLIIQQLDAELVSSIPVSQPPPPPAPASHPVAMPISSITPAVPGVQPMRAPMPRPPAVPPPPLPMGPPPPRVPPGPHGHMNPPPHPPPSGPNFMRPPPAQMGPPPIGFNRPPNIPFRMGPPHGRFDRPPHPRPDFMPPRPPGHMIPPGHMPFPGSREPLPRPHPAMPPLPMRGPPPPHGQYFPPPSVSLPQGQSVYPVPSFFTRPVPPPPPEQFPTNRPPLGQLPSSNVSVPPYQISNNEISSSVSGVDDAMELEEADTDMATEPVGTTTASQPSIDSSSTEDEILKPDLISELSESVEINSNAVSNSRALPSVAEAKRATFLGGPHEQEQASVSEEASLQDAIPTSGGSDSVYGTDGAGMTTDDPSFQNAFIKSDSRGGPEKKRYNTELTTSTDVSPQDAMAASVGEDDPAMRSPQDTYATSAGEDDSAVRGHHGTFATSAGEDDLAVRSPLDALAMSAGKDNPAVSSPQYAQATSVTVDDSAVRSFQETLTTSGGAGNELSSSGSVSGEKIDDGSSEGFSVPIVTTTSTLSLSTSLQPKCSTSPEDSQAKLCEAQVSSPSTIDILPGSDDADFITQQDGNQVPLHFSSSSNAPACSVSPDTSIHAMSSQPNSDSLQLPEDRHDDYPEEGSSWQYSEFGADMEQQEVAHGGDPGAGNLDRGDSTASTRLDMQDSSSTYAKPQHHGEEHSDVQEFQTHSLKDDSDQRRCEASEEDSGCFRDMGQQQSGSQNL